MFNSSNSRIITLSDTNNSDTQNLEKSKTEKPVSRFWACFFSMSIFALLWTGKMQKTRKWILLFSLFVFIVFFADPTMYPDGYDENSNFWHVLPNPSLEMFLDNTVKEHLPDYYSTDLVFGLSYLFLSLYERIVFIGAFFIIIYFMHKWTSQYNFDNFGYKSKREWKKANSQKRNVKDDLKNAGDKIFDQSKKTASKINEKIPSSKIKESSKFTVEKITDVINDIKSQKFGNEDIVKKLKEYYDLMLLGVITESDYEKIKEELLKSKK